MSGMILSGNATDIGSTSKLIRMGITGNAQLVTVSVAIHAPDKSFSGKYDPVAKTAGLFVAGSEFTALAAALAGGATIPITLDVDANNVVTRFCFLTTCVQVAA